MAASSSTTRPASQSYRRQALIWLVMTLVLGVVTALIWMFSQTPAMGAKIENAPISAPQVLSTDLEKLQAVESLHELDTDVQPINFDATVRDLRSYPDEFKDKRYLLANKGKWTVQVMNVAENDVIVSYLEGRADREKFSYFRYLDDDNQLRYMLIYGLMSSPQEAVGAAKLIDFRLPANVRVLPEEVNRYVSIIDNYERPEPMKDLSARRTRSVNLKPTKREVPVRQQAKTTTTNPTSVTNQTTNSTSNRSSQDTATAATNNDTSSNETTESIRQSADTSETLSVNEERTVGTEVQPSELSTPKSNDNARKTETENKKSAVSSVANSTTKKPPVVPTPKIPNSTSTNPVNKPTNTNTIKNSNDNIKELIEEKNN